MGIAGLAVRRAVMEDIPIVRDALADFAQRVGKPVDGVMALVYAALNNPAEAIFIAIHDTVVKGVLLCGVVRENLRDLAVGVPIAWISGIAPKGTWEEGLRIVDAWAVSLGARSLLVEVPFTRGIAAYQRVYLDRNSFRPVSVIFRRPVGATHDRHADNGNE